VVRSWSRTSWRRSLSERAEASAKYIFGSSLGDSRADEIHRKLYKGWTAGLTRTQISHIFGGNETTERIGVALDLLKVVVCQLRCESARRRSPCGGLVMRLGITKERI
jgi:hypothetical protein